LESTGLKTFDPEDGLQYSPAVSVVQFGIRCEITFHFLHQRFFWLSDTLTTIEAKDSDGLFNVSNKIDAACEACHKKYWYPNDPGPSKN